ncbi:COG1361 S-layer family protein [Methanoregula sp. UBA64]|uniref:COG1361 S-layer family protein n=1 Tax=Methanoregula sp. UBA64 TaxID=1915554 RepID=UPI0025D09352|nr:NEW3 domain-containing protein [Methanoregula sp. UBA64]
MAPLRACLILLITALCITVPVSAGTKYLDGSPNLNVLVSGTNEFSAGSEISIPLVIENTGFSTSKEVASSVIDRPDLPATAKFVAVTMTPGDAPFVIKSDPQMIGDLPGQAKKTVTVQAKIDSNAPAGTYLVPVNLTYTRIDSVIQYQVDSFKNYYVVETTTVYVPIVIKKEVIPGIVAAIPDHLIANSDGYLNLTIKNTGTLDGTKATVKLLRNDNSPVTPVDNSVYIGDFPAGSTVSCRYKVNVAETAQNASYPVDLVVVYQNNEGDFVTSRTETAGVAVGSKVDFVILSPPAEMNPGSKKIIQVVYKNTGSTPVRSAEARISAVKPFTSSSDISYLGDLAPGQTATATFQLKVSSDATVKDYGLDSEIRYLSSLNSTTISDPMKVTVRVDNLTGIAGILSNSVYVSVIVAIIIGIVYALYYLRKKRQ